MSQPYTIGIDLGSTTAKLVICRHADKCHEIVFSAYRRHHAKIRETIESLLSEAQTHLGNIECLVSITGSAGMGISETTGISFVQEVVASANYIKKFQPQIRTFIEIGGEDSKIIFFDDNFNADMRMNGSCAGGTGSFIDQIAVLLDIPVEEFDAYASRGTRLFPIATRCGVFAKTDVQSLLAHNVSKEDIALSTFHAVALQVLSTLPRGRDIEAQVLFGGGPLTFNSQLRKAFEETIGDFKEDDFVIIDKPQLIPAIGTSLSCDAGHDIVYTLEQLITVVSQKETSSRNSDGSENILPSLFTDSDEYTTWLSTFDQYNVKRHTTTAGETIDAFLGIDSGSTTTKIVLIDKEGKLISTFYRNNMGDPVATLRNGLLTIRDHCADQKIDVNIKGTAATGYGESLMKCAFNLDIGIVETMAHFRAASQFDPEVSFILDIGGQDMKAMYIQDGYVADIQINEACSSGCGSFIETFAQNMGYTVADFAKMACTSQRPYDLGTRCTVFMNTKVKQALREGTSIEDISAGLSFSVIKNSLYKVLKLTDTQTLGRKIVVQGGTFKNDSVLRSLELLLEREIIRPDIPELMGAYGCALKAMDNYQLIPYETNFQGLDAISEEIDIEKELLHCKGCENRCQITRLTFKNGNKFYIGNNCERIFTNNTEQVEPGENLISEKRDILFRRNLSARKPIGIRMGIPRILNMFENFPFWATFFNECGIDIILSDRSNIEIFESGVKSVCSENICFPAKIAHGHVHNLIEKGVDRIFFPNVVYEEMEYSDSVNSYNCPVVTGYPCVIRSAIDTEGKYSIPLDSPAISFKNAALLVKQLQKYMKGLGINDRVVLKAYKAAIKEQGATKKRLQDRAQALIKKAEENKLPLLVLAGRPYHIDKLINHGIPEVIADLGAIVIPEDSIPGLERISLKDVNVLTQWAYTNRLYATAKWVSSHPTAQLVQINSFGCGPDAVSVDEVRDILVQHDKLYTQIKVDEVFNLGAVKIRLRSMLEALKKKKSGTTVQKKVVTSRSNSSFSKEKTIIVPHFSRYYSPLVPSLFKSFGVEVKTLPVQDSDSINYGIKNINNEICYPAVLIAGDIIKAYQKYNYDVENTTVLLTQTGGQCRASNYVNLVKKGLDKIGFGDVSVETLSTTTLKTIVSGSQGTVLAKKMILGILVLDNLLYMYLKIKPRALDKEAVSRLFTTYQDRIGEVVVERHFVKKLMHVLDDAIEDFNNIEISDEAIPQIGFVGEIFVKYNEYANMDLIEWVLDQGAEVVLPPLQGFFFHDFISRDFMEENHITNSLTGRLTNKLIWNYLMARQKQVYRRMRAFRFYKPPHDLYHLADKTSEIVSLANQFGEGWLLTADMLSMLEEGVRNIISVQPFGCISNHVVAKGVEKRIKLKFPDFNLLAIDFDQSTSPANVFNRAHFMVASAKEIAVKKERAAAHYS